MLVCPAAAAEDLKRVAVVNAPVGNAQHPPLVHRAAQIVGGAQARYGYKLPFFGGAAVTVGLNDRHAVADPAAFVGDAQAILVVIDDGVAIPVGRGFPLLGGREVAVVLL